MKKEDKQYILARRMGGRLRELRQSYGLTQEKLAEKLEVHPSYVGQLERGEREASLHTLEKLALTFDLPPSELIKDESEPNRDMLRRQCEKLLGRMSSTQLTALHEFLMAFLHRRR